MSGDDYIAKWDKQQGSPMGKLCPRDPSHGKLWMDKTGALICCNRDCNVRLNVSPQDLLPEEALWSKLEGEVTNPLLGNLQ